MGKAILLVAFGSSNLEGINESICLLEKDLKDKFGREFTIFKAFTSKRIISLLKEKHNVFIPHITEALFNLANDEYSEVIIQPLHMMTGKETIEIQKIIDEYSYSFKKLKVAKTLLEYEGDILIDESKKIAEALYDESEVCNILLAGHGSKESSNEPYHIIYNSLSKIVEKKLYMATLEGDNTFEDILKEIQEDNIKDILIKPLFIIPGKHVMSDILGKDESWIKKLQDNGINVLVKNKSLLKYKNIRNIYIENIQRIL